jgi:FAD-linked sulfhydryl oxidase
MLQLLHALPRLYPCSHCAGDLGARMQRRPPDVRSRGALAAWLCATHNEVNAVLGKPVFDCTRVDERWRDGPPDGSCD